MRGADTVNDEFEVGFNQRFESAWYRAEVVGRFVMIVFVVCAGLGFLGRGPFSHETVKSANGRLLVDYEPIARHSTSTTLTVHVENTTQEVHPIQLSIDQHIIEPMGYQHTIPQADSAQFDDAGVRLSFLERPDQKNGLIRIALAPNVVGLVHMEVSDGPDRVGWHMLVVP